MVKWVNIVLRSKSFLAQNPNNQCHLEDRIFVYISTKVYCKNLTFLHCEWHICEIFDFHIQGHFILFLWCPIWSMAQKNNLLQMLILANVHSVLESSVFRLTVEVLSGSTSNEYEDEFVRSLSISSNPYTHLHLPNT